MSRAAGIQALKKIFLQSFGEEAVTLKMLPQSGSHRTYYRLTSPHASAVGTWHPYPREFDAFIYMTNHFTARSLPVPRLLDYNRDDMVYLQEDLGDITLMDILLQEKDDLRFNSSLICYYKQALQDLLRFQLEGAEGFDYSYCFPVPVFDARAIKWDLDTFKYYFLKPLVDVIDEPALEEDYHSLVKYLSGARTEGFMYRDFQARNILVKDQKLTYIDYQGGRRGPLQYDLVSLLYQARANVPAEVRKALLAHYLDHLEKRGGQGKDEFMSYFPAFILLRMLQVLGTYGYRGWFEGKGHFIKSVRPAIQVLKQQFDDRQLRQIVPYLHESSGQWEQLPKISAPPEDLEGQGLHVSIHSFSYLEGVPLDESGHGGGFVFDCRVVDNPGRYPEYQDKTGLDSEVIEFFGKGDSMENFLGSVYLVIGQAVEDYLRRNHEHLMVSFGCTGGRHRSVYAAQQLTGWLSAKYPVRVSLHHHALREDG
jgi:aminoglycoside/choline kinase family phosphotransferase